jgi:hypothetical protein
MPFTREDIELAAHVPDTTALAYAVSRGGEYLGRVHSVAAAGGSTPARIRARSSRGV